MKIKTFFANSMADALKTVKAELGPDALILSTKEIPRQANGGFREKSGFEVVAAIDVDDGLDRNDTYNRSGITGLREPRASKTPSQPQPPSAGPRAGTQTYIETSTPIGSSAGAGLRLDSSASEIRRLFYSMTRPAPPSAGMFADMASYEVYQDLVANDVNEWLALKLLDEAQRALPADQRNNREALFRSVLEVANGFVHASTSPDGLPGKKVVTFVGPTGVGKTTGIAKLAARLALERKKKVVVMTLDCFRIGATDQLRTYAGLIGLPFRVVNHVSELAQAIQENIQRDYILIDTTGRGPRDLDEMKDLTDFLRRSPHIEKHLVLSANTKPVDLQEVIDRFACCNPDHLLFTKLDETSTLGPIFNELVRTQKPASYFSDGQRVPEDFHVMPKKHVIDMVLNTN